MALEARAWPMLTLACAGLLAASAARAAVYAVVRWEPDVVTVIDPAAIEPVTGSDNLRRAWSVSVQKTLVSDGPQQPGYVRTLNEYDCAARKIRWASFFVHSRFGALVMHKDNDAPAWNPAAPKSEAEVAMRLVCDRSNRGSAMAAQSLSQLVIAQMRAWDEAAPLPPLQPVAERPPRKAPVRKKPVAPRDNPASQR
jgi:hypothetical protein